MNQYIKTDAWKIVEDHFDRSRVKASESLFSIGNGVMGGRASFEERYSGEMLQGNYIGAIYYPDKTRVGWWKNGYPEYFAKILNSAFWIGIDIRVDDIMVDLSLMDVEEFYRELDMKEGVLRRRFKAIMSNGVEIEVVVERFISIARRESGAIKYSITSLNRDVKVDITPYIDADVRNTDANYDEKFWEHISTTDQAVQMRTKKSGFEAAWAQKCHVDGVELTSYHRDEYISQNGQKELKKGDSLTIYKYAGICSSLNHTPDKLMDAAISAAQTAAEVCYDVLLKEQQSEWARKWHSCDIEISGDDEAQQGIRFCIFMLLQTYTGVDPRLNIGPKGFTGEKYGGVTYWDTEAYCLPFYTSTSGRDVARELLIYRYNQLDKAIENGEKLGFSGGAALYPMVTINGEECHNEWEITFEEIHRNGAIAYAIYNYVRYTGDKDYVAEYGLEVLIAIARFWAQRVNWSEKRQKFVMLGVTGPNEYENNVNNNWYTSYIAIWCMRYGAEMVKWVKENHMDRYDAIVKKRSLNEKSECNDWVYKADNLYLGKDDELEVFLQQDNYMDKEQILVRDLPQDDRPINQKWSWDRILRSCFIKQADVLQGIYLFQEDFDIETIRRNFHFYEERTLHESSLSPCVHAILATKIGDMDKAYELYLRTARLDLDDYNKEVDEGLHVTSMAGSWMSVVEGFGGMRMKDGVLNFAPALPQKWEKLSFKVNYRDRILSVNVTRDSVIIDVEGDEIELSIYNKIYMAQKQIIHRY